MATAARRRPVLALLAALLAAGVVADPVRSLAAGRQGLQLWWSAVLPSLLPFFILNDLLQALGVVRALGSLLEPVMRPLFRLPGAAGFGLAVGFTSGFPAGARTAATLTSAGLCTRDEGSLLAAFTNAAGPLFLTGVTAVSLFRSPVAGLPLALAHYGSAILAGFLLARWPSPSSGPARDERPPRRSAVNPFRRAWTDLEHGAASTPPLGHLLGAVIREAGLSVLLIGGFIVFFSVLLGWLEGSGLVGLVVRPLARLGTALGFSPELAGSVAAGLIEVTNGLNRLAAAPGPLPVRLALASGLLAWSGLSVHAQAAAVSAPANLSYRRFLVARLLQVILSPLLFLVLWPLTAGPATVARVPASLPAPLAQLRAGAVFFTVSLAALTALAAALALSRWLARRLSRRICAIWVPRIPRPRS